VAAVPPHGGAVVSATSMPVIIISAIAAQATFFIMKLRNLVTKL
jgi:hypothetical protein